MLFDSIWNLASRFIAPVPKCKCRFGCAMIGIENSAPISDSCRRAAPPHFICCLSTQHGMEQDRALLWRPDRLLTEKPRTSASRADVDRHIWVKNPTSNSSSAFIAWKPLFQAGSEKCSENILLEQFFSSLDSLFGPSPETVPLPNFQEQMRAIHAVCCGVVPRRWALRFLALFGRAIGFWQEFRRGLERTCVRRPKTHLRRQLRSRLSRNHLQCRK